MRGHRSAPPLPQCRVTCTAQPQPRAPAERASTPFNRQRPATLIEVWATAKTKTESASAVTIKAVASGPPTRPPSLVDLGGWTWECSLSLVSTHDLGASREAEAAALRALPVDPPPSATSPTPKVPGSYGRRLTPSTAERALGAHRHTDTSSIRHPPRHCGRTGQRPRPRPRRQASSDWMTAGPRCLGREPRPGWHIAASTSPTLLS
jgi:hypothetical protein